MCSWSFTSAFVVGKGGHNCEQTGLQTWNGFMAYYNPVRFGVPGDLISQISANDGVLRLKLRWVHVFMEFFHCL